MSRPPPMTIASSRRRGGFRSGVPVTPELGAHVIWAASHRCPAAVLHRLLPGRPRRRPPPDVNTCPVGWALICCVSSGRGIVYLVAAGGSVTGCRPGPGGVHPRAGPRIRDGVGCTASTWPCQARRLRPHRPERPVRPPVVDHLRAEARRRRTVDLAVRRRVAVCPDTPAFEPWLTAGEVVRSPRPRLGSTSRRTDGRRRGGCSARWTGRRGGPAHGRILPRMTQRLSLPPPSHSPGLLILDEPTSALIRPPRDLLTLIAGWRTPER